MLRLRNHLVTSIVCIMALILSYICLSAGLWIQLPNMLTLYHFILLLIRDESVVVYIYYNYYWIAPLI